MNKNIKRLLAGTGIVAGTVATAGIISYKITKKLVSIALDRGEEEPIVHDNGKEPDSPEMQHFRIERERAAEELENRGCRNHCPRWNKPGGTLVGMRRRGTGGHCNARLAFLMDKRLWADR